MNILDKGIDLSEFGIYNYAYRSQDMDEILAEIKRLNLIILGGDVFIRKSNEMILTYDNWYYNPMNNPHDHMESIEHAKNYIEKYIETNGKKYYFSFIFQ